MKTHSIYALMRDGNVFYVGASQNMPLRIREHRKRFGQDIGLVVLEDCGPDWRDREHHWINYYREKGAVLENKTAGRNGGEGLSEETRAKLSAKKKGRPKPVGFADRISAAQRGMARNWSDEGLERVKQGQFKPGSEAGKATRFTPDRRGTGEGFRDPKNLPPEVRSRRASKANATREANIAALPPAERAVIEERRRELGRRNGQASKGRRHSPEAREKIAAGRRAWLERQRAAE